MSKVHIEKNPDGRAIRLRGASVDITERKRVDAFLELQPHAATAGGHG